MVHRLRNVSSSLPAGSQPEPSADDQLVCGCMPAVSGGVSQLAEQLTGCWVTGRSGSCLRNRAGLLTSLWEADDRGLTGKVYKAAERTFGTG